MKQSVDSNIVINLAKIERSVENGRDPLKMLKGSLEGHEQDAEALLEMYYAVENNEVQLIISKKVLVELTKKENGELKYPRAAAYFVKKCLLQVPQEKDKEEYASKVKQLSHMYKEEGLFPTQGDRADSEVMAEAALSGKNMLVSLTNYNLQSGECLEEQLNRGALQVVETVAEDINKNVVTTNVQDFIEFEVKKTYKEPSRFADEIIRAINERETGEASGPQTPSQFMDTFKREKEERNIDSSQSKAEEGKNGREEK